jgi:hypothetical protein
MSSWNDRARGYGERLREPAKPTKWEIVGRYRGQSEVIDEADDERTADYLVGEYQLAYGRDWVVTKRPAGEENDDAS